MELSLHDLSSRHDIRLLVMRHAPHLPGARRLPGGRHAALRRVRVPAARTLRGDPGPLRRRAAGVPARHLPAGAARPRSGPASTSKRRRAPSERPATAWCAPSTTWPSRACWKSAAAGLRHPYRWLRRPADLDALARDLHQRTLEREPREIARLDQVLTLAAHDGCQTAFLAAHFGEHARRTPAATAPGARTATRRWSFRPCSSPGIPEPVWKQATDLRRQEEAVLGEPRAFARFLTGLTSPRLTRGKLSGHPLFGALADVPFADVLRKAEAPDSAVVPELMFCRDLRRPGHRRRPGRVDRRAGHGPRRIAGEAPRAQPVPTLPRRRIAPASEHGSHPRARPRRRARGMPTVLKKGAEFVMGDGSEPSLFPFTMGLLPGEKSSFNLERAPFDARLLDAARQAGAEVREGVALRKSYASKKGGSR